MPTVQEAQVVEYFDDLLAHLELKERMLIRALVLLLELQTLVFNGARPRLFTVASPAERTKNLLGWETSNIFQRRLVFMAIRTILLWAYVDSQEAERDMGFVPGTRRTAERKAAGERAAGRAISMARGADLIEAESPFINGHLKSGPAVQKEHAPELSVSSKEQA